MVRLCTHSRLVCCVCQISFNYLDAAAAYSSELYNHRQAQGDGLVSEHPSCQCS